MYLMIITVNCPTLRHLRYSFYHFLSNSSLFLRESTLYLYLWAKAYVLNAQPANSMASTHTLYQMREAPIAHWPAVSVKATYLHADMWYLGGRAGGTPAQPWSMPTDMSCCQWLNFPQLCQSGRTDLCERSKKSQICLISRTGGIQIFNEAHLSRWTLSSDQTKALRVGRRTYFHPYQVWREKKRGKSVKLLTASVSRMYHRNVYWPWGRLWGVLN